MKNECLLCDPFDGKYPDPCVWCFDHETLWFESLEFKTYLTDEVPMSDRDIYLGHFLVRVWTEQFWRS